MPGINVSGGGATLSAGSVETRHLTSAARDRSWLPTNAISESLNGRQANTNIGFLASGRLTLVALKPLPGGVTINSVTFVSGTTAVVTPSNQWFCLVDQSLNVLAKTVDDTTTAWAANSVKTLALSAAYTPTNDTAVYAGIVVVAATVPTLVGLQLAGGSNIVLQAPKMSGNSTAALTNPASLGATANAISGGENQQAYAYVS